MGGRETAGFRERVCVDLENLSDAESQTDLSTGGRGSGWRQPAPTPRQELATGREVTAFSCGANEVNYEPMNDIKNYSIPFVIERDGRGNERSFDLYSRLLVDRIIFI